MVGGGLPLFRLGTTPEPAVSRDDGSSVAFGVAYTEQWVGSHTELSRMVALFDANQRCCRHLFHGRCVRNRIHVVDSLCSQLWLSYGTGVEQWAVCAQPTATNRKLCPAATGYQTRNMDEQKWSVLRARHPSLRRRDGSKRVATSVELRRAQGDTGGTVLCKGDENGCAPSSCQS